MKTILTLLSFFFVSLSFSQITKIETEKPIKETKIAPMGTFWASIQFYEDYSTLSFRDSEYQHILEVVSFTLDNETMDQLYDLLVSKDAKEDDFYKIDTMDGKTTLALSYIKKGRKVYPLLLLYEGEFDEKGSRLPPMTNKQFAKLFDKKNK